MKPLTDAEKFRILIAQEETLGSIAARDSPQERVRKRIGISRVSLWKLQRDGGNLKQKALRGRLNAEFSKACVEPGSSSYQARLKEIREVLGDEPGKAADVGAIDRQLIEHAHYAWSVQARDPSYLDDYRLLQGRLAQRVMFDWLKHAKLRASKGGILFPVADDEVAKNGLGVIETMVDIVARNRQPPKNFFVGGSDIARRNGYRLFRATLANDHLGWLAYKPGLTLAERVGILSAAYERKVHEDMAWASTFQPDEIGWPYNAWNLALHAGDWSGSVKLAVPLFTKWPSILTTTISGLKPVKDDPEMWPGIAAILEDDSADALDGLRSQLNEAAPEMATMMQAMPSLRAAVAAGASYVEALATIKEGETK